jgi:hypothetical protein
MANAKDVDGIELPVESDAIVSDTKPELGTA